MQQKIGVLRSSTSRRKVRQSSTFEDVADHILLQDDGDLLTIHQAPNDTVEVKSVDNLGINYQCENPEVRSEEDVETCKTLEISERGDILNRFVSASPSMQTIISKTEAQIKGNLAHAERRQNESWEAVPPDVHLYGPEEEWI